MARFQNSQTSVLATGLALNAGQAYYVSGAGPSMAVDSIWASLVGNNTSILAPEWYSRHTGFNFGGEKGAAKTQKQPLTESSYKHFVTYNPSESVILLIDPAAAGEQESGWRRVARMEEVMQRFYLWLKWNYDIPVQRHWSEPIWDFMTKRYPNQVRQISSMGDCVGCWILNVDASFWVPQIVEMVKRKELSF